MLQNIFEAFKGPPSPKRPCAPRLLFYEFRAQVAQAPKGAVNMTLRNSVIFIRVCMGIERSYKIVQNRGKRFNKIDLPSHRLCITCVSMVFGGISKRFQWVFGSLFAVNMTLRNSVIFVRVCMGI